MDENYINDPYQRAAYKAWQDIAQAVRDRVNSGALQLDIQKLLGLKSKSVISNWLKGNNTSVNASFPDMLRYLDRLGLDVNDYLPKSPTIHRLAPNAPVEQVKGHGLPTVPVLGTTGAGDPQELFSEKPEFTLEILPQYAHKGSIALRVEGDSMEPTIRKGAYVGVIPIEEDIIEGGIYLVYIPPFGRVVKRVRIREIGELELYSDNAAYQPLRVPVEQYEKIVLGRVLWVWQKI